MTTPGGCRNLSGCAPRSNAPSNAGPVLWGQRPTRGRPTVERTKPWRCSWTPTLGGGPPGVVDHRPPALATALLAYLVGPDPLDRRARRGGPRAPARGRPPRRPDRRPRRRRARPGRAVLRRLPPCALPTGRAVAHRRGLPGAGVGRAAGQGGHVPRRGGERPRQLPAGDARARAGPGPGPGGGRA